MEGEKCQMNNFENYIFQLFRILHKNINYDQKIKTLIMYKLFCFNFRVNKETTPFGDE